MADVNKKQFGSLSNYILKGLFNVLSFAVAALLSATPIFSSMFPLGVAFATAVPSAFSVSAAVGAFLGYFIPAFFGSGLKYISILFGAASLKAIIIRFKKDFDTAVCAAGVTAAVTFFIGLISIWDFSGLNFLNCIAESILASTFSFFMHKAFSKSYTDSSGINNSDLAALLISVNIILLGLYNITIGTLSLGRIVAVVIILAATYLRHTSAGGICGVSFALSLYLSGCPAEMALILAAGGLLSGFFSSFGKVASALSVMLSAVLSAVMLSVSKISISFIAEAFIGGIIFLILPSKLNSWVAGILAKKTNIMSQDAMKKTLIMRLDNASSALKGVTEMVDMVSQKLEKYTKTDYSTVLKHVENDACKGCILRLNCWENNHDETLEAVLSYTSAIKQGRKTCLAEIPTQFADRCLRLERFENAVNVHYGEFLSSQRAENRVREMRGILTEQTFGIAEMLKGLSKQFDEALLFDSATAETVAAALKTLGIRADDCGCVIDRSNRMTIEVRANHLPDEPVNRRRILNVIEQACGRKFNPPMVKKEDDTITISICEKAAYTVDFAVSSRNCKNNMLSGDSTEGFFDGRGRFFMLLSDGMGAGSRAAVDSAMVIGLMGRLVRAGFSYGTALNIINSALVYKSTDESLATVDIACIDLFNGTAELLKAGAAPTIVRRSGRAGKAQCNSLPVGILKDASFDRAVVHLKEKDAVVMMSDGATAEGTEWIIEEIESSRDKSAKQLADQITDSAYRRRTDRHEDDITVMVAIIEREV